ncbi:hypothetical protein OU415_07645 [Saccharopolyspora sp. WRP15-2]|uniref:Uncharacterized protein n=1 Tax=Saccharopolyspora oryzae TaxID=2997343 RepID=A0ABT4UU99_9PSEU|nr:hypothetical protein [Saccharopolyspora oryzae]MDA3625304.1 hypothetical protein [Saccharopolyspora oryzae]
MSYRGHPRTRGGSTEVRARHRRNSPDSIVVHTGRARRSGRPGQTTLDISPDREVRRIRHVADPVFVDRSGRRRRVFRRFFLAASLVLVCLGLFLASAMLNSRTPAPPLPTTAQTNS